MAKDRDYNKLIHTRRWLRLRRDILSAHPLCERCASDGFVTPATKVHHRYPVEHGVNYHEKRRLMYDPEDLMAMCHECHVKTHAEMERSGDMPEATDTLRTVRRDTVHDTITVIRPSLVESRRVELRAVTFPKWKPTADAPDSAVLSNSCNIGKNCGRTVENEA